MSETLLALTHRITSAEELKSVVRTMKAIAASNIVRYEQAVRALDVYDDTVRRGLAVALREGNLAQATSQHNASVVVFGSDQGLVGQFNEDLSGFVVENLAGVRQPVVWAVGERVAWSLTSKAVAPMDTLTVPTTLHAITGLVGQLLERMHPWMLAHPQSPVLVMHQRPQQGGQYAPVNQRLLPLDEEWRQSLFTRPWPGRRVPELCGDRIMNLRALIREYLFVSLYRACAESLAGENASRLAAMQRADKNIDDMLVVFKRDYNRARQDGIDEELFDVIAGFEAQTASHPH